MPQGPARGGSALILANPVSGGGRARRRAPQLAAELGDLGWRAEVFFTAQAGDARRRAARAGAEPWDVLVAAGGDGTVAEVLDGMPDPRRRLAVLPIGTANVLALEYGLPRRPAAVAALIASGRVREHAVGRAGDRRFLLFCGAGIDGAVVRRLHQVRSGTLGKHKWLGPILHTVRRWPRYDLAVELDSGETLADLRSVLVTRVRNYGGVVRLTPDIDPGDGWLHVLCFRRAGRLAWLAQGLRALCGRLRPGPGLAVRQVRGLRITGAAPYQLDGDYAGETPVELRLEDAPIRLCAPPPAGG